jgi:hypothetical protein
MHIMENFSIGGIDMKQWNVLMSPLIVAVFLCLLSGLCLAQEDKVSSGIANETTNNISIDQKTYDIGLDAYIYLYPLVSMDLTRLQITNVEKAGDLPGSAPENTFAHFRDFVPPGAQTINRPNQNLLYSTGILNLTDGPVIISVPDTQGRWYLLEMIDMWTDVFAAPGKRTTGTTAGNFAFTLPCWNGTLPEGVTRIDSPTPYVWIGGRTQTNGTSDLDAVHKIQDGYKITPLDQWGKELQPIKGIVDPSVDMVTGPFYQVNAMNASTFYTYAAKILKVNPPHLTDQPIIAQMKYIGIEPGKNFNFDKLEPAKQKALDKAAKDGLNKIRDFVPKIGEIVNGWNIPINGVGTYGSDYLRRAAWTYYGIGVNLPEDAIYPLLMNEADGTPFNGNNTYLLHFNASEIPPVDAFWSITMYNADGYTVNNSINRYALSDSDNLTFNSDDSLDIYIQHESPGVDKESNWLPAPQEPISIVMRLYMPRAEVKEGTWSPPPLRRVQ